MLSTLLSQHLAGWWSHATKKNILLKNKNKNKIIILFYLILILCGWIWGFHETGPGGQQTLDCRVLRQQRRSLPILFSLLCVHTPQRSNNARTLNNENAQSPTPQKKTI